jgi:hypothetical protein
MCCLFVAVVAVVVNDEEDEYKEFVFFLSLYIY